jgi:hypothetical protein
MNNDLSQATSQAENEGWPRYGRALLHSMAEVRAETSDGVHPLLLETADYWLSLGLAIGTEQPEAAVRLLRLIETEEPERAELTTDAKQFVTEALG